MYFVSDGHFYPFFDVFVSIFSEKVFASRYLSPSVGLALFRFLFFYAKKRLCKSVCPSFRPLVVLSLYGQLGTTSGRPAGLVLPFFSFPFPYVSCPTPMYIVRGPRGPTKYGVVND